MDEFGEQLDGPVDASADPALAIVAARAAGQMTAENFPVALRLIPRGPRSELAAVYRFARFVDDLGDETDGGPDERLRLLDAIDADVRRLDGGSAVLAPVVDLTPLVREHAVPLKPFLDLIEANRVDQRVSSYRTFDELLGYCRLSAAPVGRIVLHLAEAATPQNIADSDSVCAALQVLEHCQDVGEDARAGRVYLPGLDLEREGIAAAVLSESVTTPALRRAVAIQVVRARDLLVPGRPLVSRLSGWARFAVSGYIAGGLATADALAAAKYDVLAQDVRPSKVRTAGQAIGLLVRAR
jgi:squalene synthase HpnC